MEAGTLLFCKDCEFTNHGPQYLKLIGITFSVFNFLLHPSIFLLSLPPSPLCELALDILHSPLIPENSEAEDKLALLIRRCSEFCLPAPPLTEHWSEDKSLDVRMVYVYRYIRKHYNEPLTLDLLANLVTYNPVYLSNKFTKIFKVSPLRFLQSVRIKKAQELLTDTKLSVCDIGKAVGYLTPSQFCIVFKKNVSLTPYQFRINSQLKKINN